MRALIEWNIDMNSDQLKIIFQNFDINQNGQLNVKEFQELMNAYEEDKVNTKNDVINIFEQFDKDSNGQINFEELKYMLVELYPLSSLGVYSD